MEFWNLQFLSRILSILTRTWPVLAPVVVVIVVVHWPGSPGSSPRWGAYAFWVFSRRSMISFVFSAIFFSASMSLLLNAFLYSIFLSRFIYLHSASICSCVSLSSLHILHIWLLCDVIILLFAGIILHLILIMVLHSLLFSLFMYSGLTFGTIPWFICSQCLVFDFVSASFLCSFQIGSCFLCRFSSSVLPFLLLVPLLWCCILVGFSLYFLSICCPLLWLSVPVLCFACYYSIGVH